jgi:hypothetical protein
LHRTYTGSCAESTYAAIEPMLFAATRRPAAGLSRANPDQAEDEAAADFSRQVTMIVIAAQALMSVQADLRRRIKRYRLESNLGR